MKLKLKVVFIDWYKTLSASLFWEPWRSSLHPLYSSFEKIGPVLFKEMKSEQMDWMRGKLSSEQIISKLSHKTGLDYNLLLSEFISSCRNMKFYSPKTLNMLKIIQSQGIKVIIATDNMDSFQRWTVPSLGLKNTFDEILDSASIGWVKEDFDQQGDSLFFRKFFEFHDLSPQETVLIDDSEDKGRSLAKFGINYIKIRPLDGLEPALSGIIYD